MGEMSEYRNILILTGAGISAESGLATFRGPDGLWEGHRVEDVCTPEAYRRDPALVQRFYDARRAKLAEVVPNAAHVALAWLAREWSAAEVLIVTQNVDDLHERAGAPVDKILHMHGQLKSALCLACGARSPWGEDLGHGPACPVCDAVGVLRPDIVWFGEMPYQMGRIERALERCDLFVAIGTSGAVYPAAGFVRTARHYGADTLEFNLEPSEGSLFFAETRLGRASELVPAFVEELLADAA